MSQRQSASTKKSHSADRDVLWDQIYEEIEEITKCRGDESLFYFCPRDLQARWNSNRVGRMLSFNDRDLIKTILEKMTCILTILIMIHADDTLENFRANLFQGTKPIVTDQDLPLSLEELFFIKSNFTKKEFEKLQWHFCPYTIRISGDEVIEVDSRFKLPFESNPKETEIGCGASGEVSVVKISPGHLIRSNNIDESVS
jgi:hypothetical protein